MNGKCWKPSFPTATDALRSGHGRRAYRCRHCRGFHATAEPPLSKRDLERRAACYR